MDLLDQLADTFFNWEEMAKVIPALLMVGLPNTLILAVASGILGSLLGLGLAMMGISRNAGARWVARIYTDIFRGLPAIICIYLVGFGLPLTGLPLIGNWPPEWYAILALTLTYGAYVAEVYRAGIESVHWSQVAAARSLGLSFFQTLRFVVVPQAVRRIIPPLLNDFISLQKDVALVAILGPQEAFRVAQIDASSTFNYTPLLAAAALYLCVTIPLARVLDHMQRRSR